MNEIATKTTPDHWIAAAIEKGLSTEQLRDLLAIKREYDADEARKAFASAMRDVQAALPKVLCDRINDQTRSRYASLDAIIETCMPIIADCGFSLSAGTDAPQINGCIGITLTVRHSAGHSEQARCDVPLDLTGIAGKTNKTAVHAHGSSMSYGRRYLAKLFFNIYTGDDDDGNKAGSSERITDEQHDELMDLAAKAGADMAGFLKYLKVDALMNLPASKYKAAVAALEAKRKAAQGEAPE